MKILINRENSISLTTVFIYFTLTFLTLSFQMTAGYSEDVIVITTRSVPDGIQILKGFRSICDSSVKIKEYDMKGKLKEGKKIIKEIKKAIESNPPIAVLTIGGPATKLAQETLTNISILFSMVVNPKKKGFSGNNISGISSNVPIKLQLEKLKMIIPEVKKIGIIYNPENTDNIIEEAKQVAIDMGLELVISKISSHKEVPGAIRDILDKIDALLLITDKTVVNKNSFKYIITTTLENKVPTMVYTDHLVKAGFLLSLTPDYFSIGKQVGNFVCKSQEHEDDTRTQLSSIKSPEKVNLAINLKTAKRIGLNISSSILASANVFK